MSRILVVQPSKMLQQAFVVALFPEHHVRVLEKIPDAVLAPEADLVIIDATALRERDLLPPHEVRAAQSWRIPVVWIGVESLGELAASKNLARLSAPVKRDELRTAVAESLRSPSAGQASPERAAKRAGSVVAARKKATEPKQDHVATDNDKKFIELVDVIDETPGYDDELS